MAPARRQGDVLRVVRRREFAFGEDRVGVGMLAVLSHLPVWILQRPVAHRYLAGGTSCFG